MNFAATLLLAFAMSTDAFAAAIGKGTSLHKPRFSDALRAGVIFGVIEAITPLIGWLVGSVAAKYVENWDHWLAFVMLSILGLLMIRNAVRAPGEDEADRPPRKHSFWNLALTGFATSIDAMAIGVSLAFIDNNILVTASVIGLATLLMVTTGFMLGRVLGSLAGKRAEIFGGLVLIGVGTSILFEHLRA
ncbi:manganese efflux pump MntP [Achromobacter aloeverae]|uniref:Putative manganese efflux pump MntP n=1 Tax=Achromobacter aloeverae TaxID=1750518 RepID=A0A4Q1HIP5_9BURK|nr:manganese efflux pump MntP [Achromobacter aloeverae]RXN88078.1 manganese efflux pump MntP [Achromobacter aloeverae]